MPRDKQDDILARHVEAEKAHRAVLRDVVHGNPDFLRALRFFFGARGTAFDFARDRDMDPRAMVLQAAKIDGELAVVEFLASL